MVKEMQLGSNRKCEKRGKFQLKKTEMRLERKIRVKIKSENK